MSNTTCQPIVLTLALLIFSMGGYAQISPGKLAQPHAHLEGMANCTQCHDLGNKVPDSKCLACHKEIDRLIDRGRGYHASREVQTKTCVKCHNEHHGRHFQLIRFEEDLFDHDLTGYSLKGAHAKIDCRACHKPDYIKDRELRKRSKTFLGLGKRCVNCHDDAHEGTLGNDCAQCHGFDDFKPASRFDHNKDADFALRGAHKEVDCKECHPLTTVRGNVIQQFAGVEFSDCMACHEDPHLANLPGKCSECHKETAFADFIGEGRFDHDQTGFELRGKHKEVNCFKCHKRNREVEDLFIKDYRAISERSCAKCHKDVHNGKFGKDCASCHREKSFRSLRNMNRFNHALTDFPLVGNHIGVKCKACHKRRYSVPIDFSRCDNCHKDYHEGVFKKASENPDCGDCHLVEQKFTYTTFGFDEHEKTRFPLEGAHMATPCFACHLADGDRWKFADLGERCVDCHEDIHEGFISSDFYSNDDCTRCHQPDSWAKVTFDHELTEWPLQGAHAQVRCGLCHMKEKDPVTGKKQQVFKGLDTRCATCHEDVHAGQFAGKNFSATFEVLLPDEQTTNCASCHTPDDWFPHNFDHNRTAFPLDGQHEKLDCSACHFKGVSQDVIIYKNGKTKCTDCHS